MVMQELTKREKWKKNDSYRDNFFKELPHKTVIFKILQNSFEKIGKCK